MYDFRSKKKKRRKLRRKKKEKKQYFQSVENIWLPMDPKRRYNKMKFSNFKGTWGGGLWDYDLLNIIKFTSGSIHGPQVPVSLIRNGNFGCEIGYNQEIMWDYRYKISPYYSIFYFIKT